MFSLLPAKVGQEIILNAEFKLEFCRPSRMQDI
jgi:hypothetical protein